MQTEDSRSRASSRELSAVEQERIEERPTGNTASEQEDPFARAQRRKLPNERKSITHKFSVGGQEGYVIVGVYEDGRPGEVFVKMSKEGSTLSGVMDGLALTLSIGLQYGVPLKVLVDKLVNMRFEPSGLTDNSDIRFASSVLDYVGRWLGGKFISPAYLKLGTPGGATARETASNAEGGCHLRVMIGYM